MKNFIYQSIIVLCVVSVLFFFLSCGDQSGSDNGTSEGNSSIVFRIAPPGSETRAAAMDCAELGIVSVSAWVYSSTNELLKTGGPWDCELGEGIIEGVPSAQTARVVIICHDEEDHMHYRGESLDIALEADQVADAGVIITDNFVPILESPATGSSVDISSVSLVWEEIASAQEYQVRVSTSANFSGAIVVNQVFSKPPCTITGSEDENSLVTDTPYYWEVYAIDEHGNMSAGSAVWHFTTMIPDSTIENNLPVVFIEPLSATSFEEGHLVLFQGSATDSEDGSLSGNALVWTSDIDGEIGTGNSVEISSLSVGNHTIRLKATDSEGASQTTDISITITANLNQPPNGEIKSPYDDSYVYKGNDVYFSGIGTDFEDGALAGTSLSWRSDIDGFLSNGITFYKNNLSIGTHHITLTVTDSDGLTGQDTVIITVQPQIIINTVPQHPLANPVPGLRLQKGIQSHFPGQAMIMKTVHLLQDHFHGHPAWMAVWEQAATFL